MKKLALFLAAISIGLACHAQTSDSTKIRTEKALKEYKVEIRNVKGPNNNNVKVFSKTYLYPTETIEKAIKERLKKEGLSYKKKSNGFFACTGIKYNPLWDKTFDFYIAVIGSKNAGTVNLLISTGYDNFIDETNTTACLNAAKWLYSLDYDIQLYIHNNNLASENKTLTDLEKDLTKLKKEKANIESKIDKNATDIKKFEAQRINTSNIDLSTIDTKQLEKEKKQERKLQDEKNSLNYDLKEIEVQIETTEKKIQSQKNVINDLKANMPNEQE